MDETHCLDYRDTGYFSKLITDYLEQKPGLQKYYHRYPTLENFSAQIEERKSFPAEARQVLVRSLKRQYGSILNDDASTVLKNIEALESPNTFTVVTGHQLNIFTGPLYFIYKIFSTINLTVSLAERYPGYNFVPVYWMATEDHDFEEINHINLYGGKLSWERESSGPVGRFSTSGLEEVIDELATHLGPGTHALEFIEILKKSYLNAENLSAATRQLVHTLFGDHGLVVVDGDDAELKRLAIPYFKDELLNGFALDHVEETSKALQEEYFEQVTAREINLFYIRDGLRERLIKSGEKWGVVDTSITFTRNELLKELEDFPGRFSPNVILRPFYQELVLPNLAYIGGGGELAYWLQLKSMFGAWKMPFPMLVLRNSALWVPDKARRKLDSIGLSVEDMFKPLHEIKKQFVKEHAPVDTELSPYEQKLQQIFDDLEEVAHLTDKSMLGAVNAQRQKQLNGLENLKKKLIRAEKRRQDVQMEKIEDLYYSLFPNGSLQERHDNLSVYYAEYGPEWLERVKGVLDPLSFQFCVIRDQAR